MRKFQVDQQYWHAVPNDEVGGWAITNYNTDATSKLDFTLGQLVVADCRSEQIARHIVEVHNKGIDQRVEDALFSFFDIVEVRVVKGSAGKMAARVTVGKGSPLLAYERAIEQAAGAAVDTLRNQANG